MIITAAQSAQPTQSAIAMSTREQSARTDVDRALGENQTLIAAILEQQNAGRIVSASALLDRLQQNLAYVAAVAEMRGRESAGPISAPLLPAAARQHNFLGGGAGAGAGGRVAVALAPAGAVPAQPGAENVSGRPWSKEENERLEKAMERFGNSGKEGRPNYKAIAREIGTRSSVQVRSHVHKMAKRRERDKDKDNVAEATTQGETGKETNGNGGTGGGGEQDGRDGEDEMERGESGAGAVGVDDGKRLDESSSAKER